MKRERVSWLVVDKRGRGVNARRMKWWALSLAVTLNRVSPQGAPHDAVRVTYQLPTARGKRK